MIAQPCLSFPVAGFAAAVAATGAGACGTSVRLAAKRWMCATLRSEAKPSSWARKARRVASGAFFQKASTAAVTALRSFASSVIHAFCCLAPACASAVAAARIAGLLMSRWKAI